VDCCDVSADWGGHRGALRAAVDRGIYEGVFIEELKGWVVFREDLPDACCEDHFNIGKVSENDADGPEPGVCFWGPGLIELVVCEFEYSWVDGLDSDAKPCDEFFGGELLECFDGGGGDLVVHVRRIAGGGEFLADKPAEFVVALLKGGINTDPEQIFIRGS